MEIDDSISPNFPPVLIGISFCALAFRQTRDEVEAVLALPSSRRMGASQRRLFTTARPPLDPGAIHVASGNEVWYNRSANA